MQDVFQPPIKSLTRISQNETRTFSDSWKVNLAPILEGKSPTWERMSRKGVSPSIRSGFASCGHRGSLMVFGGVLDNEQEQHRIASVFYDDLFGLSIKNKKWYKVSARQQRQGKAGAGEGRGERRETEALALALTPTLTLTKKKTHRLSRRDGLSTSSGRT